MRRAIPLYCRSTMNSVAEKPVTGSPQLFFAMGRCISELRRAVLETSGAPGGWQSGGSFTNSRSMPLNGFTPGATYTIQARAIGGSTGYSDWSDPVSHMCM